MGFTLLSYCTVSNVNEIFLWINNDNKWLEHVMINNNDTFRSTANLEKNVQLTGSSKSIRIEDISIFLSVPEITTSYYVFSYFPGEWSHSSSVWYSSSRSHNFNSKGRKGEVHRHRDERTREAKTNPAGLHFWSRATPLSLSNHDL